MPAPALSGLAHQDDDALCHLRGARKRGEITTRPVPVSAQRRSRAAVEAWRARRRRSPSNRRSSRLVTRSANDAATVLGRECLGGSEDRFAPHDDHTARALGMTRTTYRNANGLPNTGAGDDGTRSWPRLGIALGRRFSAVLPYFSTPQLQLWRRSASATTTACSARSRASMASRPATPALPASTSSRR